MLTLKATANFGNLESRVMGQIDRAQRAALEAVKPVIQETLVKTIGTEYYTLSALRKMHGPYSAENPHPPMPPGVINAHTREFYESRHIIGPTSIGGRLVLAFYITSRKTDYINATGTVRMMGRDYKTLLQSRLRRQVKKALADKFAGMIQIKVKG